MLLRRFPSCSVPRSFLCSTASMPFLASQQRTFLVHHRKTPNPDCMMFLINDFQFRIGSQEKLTQYIQSQHQRQKQAANDADDDDDWDGPGPIRNAAERHAKDEQRKSENERKMEELRKRHTRGFSVEQATTTNSAATAADNSVGPETSERKPLKPACDLPELPKVQLPSRNKEGGSIFSAASRPIRPNTTTVTSTTTNAATAASSSEDGTTAAASAVTTTTTTTMIINDKDAVLVQPGIDDAAACAAGITVIQSTYTFTADEKHLSPLAKRVFESNIGKSLAEVIIGKDFVTVRRKSDEDLAEEFAAEQERKRLAEESGESVLKGQDEYEFVATSMSTLTGMMGRGGGGDKENKNMKSSNEDGEKTTPLQEQEQQENAGQERDKLAQLYRESDEKIKKSTEATAAAKAEAKKQKVQQEQRDTKDATSEAAVAPDGDIASKARAVEVPDDERTEPEKATEWFDLLFDLSAAITDHLYFNEVAVDLNAKHPYADTEPHESDSEIVSSIKELIAQHLRPLLQSDGGDIKFLGYDEPEAVMRIEMLGSCKTCKKSDTTLKDLIERTVTHFVPEVKQVVEVNLHKKRKQQQQQQEQLQQAARDEAASA